MELIYKNKSSYDVVFKDTVKANFQLSNDFTISENLLIQSENLSAMKSLLVDFNFWKKIDLVYIDPPFSTNSTFSIGKNRTSTISKSNNDEIAYTDNLLGYDFLEFLRKRLILIRELMSDESSIYLHIDYKIGHYVKIIMDEIFGINNFRNDITRIKCNPKNFKRNGYGNIKDLILFYTKSSNFIFNEPLVDRSPDELSRLFPKTDKNGRHYTTTPLHAPGETVNGNTGKEWHGLLPPTGRHWRYDPKNLDALDQDGLIEWSVNGVPRKIVYADEKPLKRIQDIWEFKDPQYPHYPTQKNSDLLKLIINTSSNENSLVMDCFCGSGTTIIMANELNRNWIGIDESEHAIKVCKKRLDNSQPMFTSYSFLKDSNLI